MKKLIHKITTSKTAIFIFYLFIRLYSLTVRMKIENEDEWLNRQQNGMPVLICLTHQQFFYMIRFFRRYFKAFECQTIISKSRDGDIVAWLAEFLGVSAQRGSSSKGGRAAMEGLIEFLLIKKGLGFIIIDGPRGPLGVVKPGPIRIAQRTGAYIVPAFLISKDVWYVNSWDRFMIPKPFSKVTLKFGSLMKINDTNSNEEFEAKRLELEKNMAPYIIKEN